MLKLILILGFLSIQTFAGGGWWYAGHKIVYVDTFYANYDKHLKEVLGLPDSCEIWNEPSNDVRMKIWKYAVKLRNHGHLTRNREGK